MPAFLFVTTGVSALGIGNASVGAATAVRETGAVAPSHTARRALIQLAVV